MQVIARRTLKEFWARHPPAEAPIRAWLAVATAAHWANPAEIKRGFGGSVDFFGDNRIVFDLGGNKYRLVVHVSYTFGRILVKFIGTHAEYDRIDPETVSWRRR
jgi:mRNA interferase HigB